MSRAKLPHPGLYVVGKARRLRRIRRRATAELGQAFEEGVISLRQYDLLSRLGVQEQRAKIRAKIVGLVCERESARIAAETIGAILEGSKVGPIRLSEIAGAIGKAVRAGQVPTR